MDECLSEWFALILQLEREERFADVRKVLQDRSRAGDLEASLRLASYLECGVGGPPNQRRAASLYLKAANMGSLVGAYGIGCCYLEGRGVRPDAVAARFYIRSAAKGQIPEAEFMMGELCAGKWGMKIKTAEAIDWYELAVAHGFNDARFPLAVLHLFSKSRRADQLRSVELLSQLVDENHSESAYLLGQAYCGRYGFSKNLSMAKRMLRLAARLGHGEAALDLGVMSFEGGEGRRNVRAAKGWYELAAGLGNVSAMYNLGLLHGDPLDRKYYDVIVSRSWLKQAVDHGHKLASKPLIRLAALS